MIIDFYISSSDLIFVRFLKISWLRMLLEYFSNYQISLSQRLSVCEKNVYRRYVWSRPCSRTYYVSKRLFCFVIIISQKQFAICKAIFRLYLNYYVIYLDQFFWFYNITTERFVMLSDVIQPLRPSLHRYFQMMISLPTNSSVI